MHVLFALAHYYLPQFAGGVQSSTHELALELLKRGMTVSVAANLMGNDLVGFLVRAKMKMLRRKFSRDRLPGYPVYRSWLLFETVDHILPAITPDVVVVQPRHAVRVALAFQRAKLPIVMYLRDVEFQDHAGSIQELNDVRYVANSQFTAETYRKAFGIHSTVIPPLFHAERYRTQTTRRNVTMVNPHPFKGVELAIKLAEKCPEIPFSFVESWALEPSYRATLQQRLSHFPNVTLRSRTADMRSVYSEARLILVPSQWEEAWGRIASEAHFSGIPVLASRTGGLPESVGPGGILVAKDAPVECWASHLQRLWTDEAFYRKLSNAALAYAGRPELNTELQIGAFIRILQEATGTARSAGTERHERA
jgi:glycosyltransferase involved in cell wall biosynthesis